MSAGFYICTRSGRALFGPFATRAEAEQRLTEYPLLLCALNVEERIPLHVVGHREK